MHHDGDTAVHGLPPEAKIAATVAFVFAVVATPREAAWAFGLDALVLAGVARLARLPARLALQRLRIELPFLAFAVFMPIVGAAPRVDVLAVSLSEPGLWAAWNIVVKGTLGVLAAIILAATTPVTELLAGLERLRVPRVLTAIAGFMVRYLDVINSEAARMRVARLSRGYDPRWIWQARAIAATGGTMFVRSYERGERVYLAMCSRGYNGSMPELHHHAAQPHAWRTVASVPALAVLFMVVARVVVA
ncbi:MAG: cobalt ECF transporter T component CbiQ [Actinobacteria bacterium]|nr:cobalt ECF transporter T component CbiQ [Actinomycetota bacterium]